MGKKYHQSSDLPIIIFNEDDTQHDLQLCTSDTTSLHDSAYDDIDVQRCDHISRKEQPGNSYNKTLNVVDHSLSTKKSNFEQILEVKIHPKFDWAESECNITVSTHGIVLASLESKPNSDKTIMLSFVGPSPHRSKVSDDCDEGYDSPILLVDMPLEMHTVRC